jgi:hypothetical protein
MKPTRLAFVVPGMALEYGLRSSLNPTGEVPVADLPLSGIAGTVLGSLVGAGRSHRSQSLDSLCRERQEMPGGARRPLLATLTEVALLAKNYNPAMHAPE